MGKRDIVDEIQLDLESDYGREEVVVIDDESQADEQTEPPAGFEDLIYETWRDMQPPKNEGGHHNKGGEV